MWYNGVDLVVGWFKKPIRFHCEYDLVDYIRENNIKNFKLYIDEIDSKFRHVRVRHKILEIRIRRTLLRDCDKKWLKRMGKKW